MKRIALLAALILLICSLISCRAPDPLAEETTREEVQTSELTLKEREELFGGLADPGQTYHYGWELSVYRDRYKLFEGVYTYTDMYGEEVSFPTFLKEDLETGEVTPVCADGACTHTYDSGCPFAVCAKSTGLPEQHSQYVQQASGARDKFYCIVRHLVVDDTVYFLTRQKEDIDNKENADRSSVNEDNQWIYDALDYDVQTLNICAYNMRTLEYKVLGTWLPSNDCLFLYRGGYIYYVQYLPREEDEYYDKYLYRMDLSGNAEKLFCYAENVELSVYSFFPTPYRAGEIHPVGIDGEGREAYFIKTEETSADSKNYTVLKYPLTKDAEPTVLTEAFPWSISQEFYFCGNKAFGYLDARLTSVDLKTGEIKAALDEGWTRACFIDRYFYYLPLSGGKATLSNGSEVSYRSLGELRRYDLVSGEKKIFELTKEFAVNDFTLEYGFVTLYVTPVVDDPSIETVREKDPADENRILESIKVDLASIEGTSAPVGMTRAEREKEFGGLFDRNKQTLAGTALSVYRDQYALYEGVYTYTDLSGQEKEIVTFVKQDLDTGEITPVCADGACTHAFNSDCPFAVCAKANSDYCDFSIPNNPDRWALIRHQVIGDTVYYIARKKEDVDPFPGRISGVSANVYGIEYGIKTHNICSYNMRTMEYKILGEWLPSNDCFFLKNGDYIYFEQYLPHEEDELYDKYLFRIDKEGKIEKLFCYSKDVSLNLAAYRVYGVHQYETYPLVFDETGEFLYCMKKETENRYETGADCTLLKYPLDEKDPQPEIITEHFPWGTTDGKALCGDRIYGCVFDEEQLIDRFCYCDLKTGQTLEVNTCAPVASGVFVDHYFYYLPYVEGTFVNASGQEREYRTLGEIRKYDLLTGEEQNYPLSKDYTVRYLDDVRYGKLTTRVWQIAEEPEKPPQGEERPQFKYYQIYMIVDLATGEYEVIKEGIAG